MTHTLRMTESELLDLGYVIEAVVSDDDARWVTGGVLVDDHFVRLREGTSHEIMSRRRKIGSAAS